VNNINNHEYNRIIVRVNGIVIVKRIYRLNWSWQTREEELYVFYIELIPKLIMKA